MAKLPPSPWRGAGDARLYVKPIIFAVFQLIESLCGGLLRTVAQYCGKTAEIIGWPNAGLASVEAEALIKGL